MSNVLNPSATDKLFRRESVMSLTGTKTITISPDLAFAWLEWNDKNRNISRPQVKRLVSEMANGNWKLNGQCLIMSDGGRLLDGQHRLTAILEYGSPITTDVRFGIDPSTFSTIDEGKKRNPGDVFKISGYSDANNLAAACKIVMAYDLGRNQASGGAAQVPTNTILLEWAGQNPSIEDDLATARSLYGASDNMILSRSKIAGYVHITKRLDEEAALKFFSQLTTGIGMKNLSPVHILRRRLLKSKMDKMHTLPASIENGLVIQAWNAWRKGKSPKFLRYIPKTGKNPRFK